MIELAGIDEGHSVLDVATGIGEPATSAARRVGPSGHVVAVDQAPQMLDIARDRATELGLSNITFVETDAESLELPEGDFDAVLCRFGIMLVPDVKRATSRIRELLGAEGRFVATVWGDPEKCPSASIAMRVMSEALDLPAPLRGHPGMFSLANPSPLVEALEEAGFSNVEVGTVNVPMHFDSARQYVDFLKDVVGPVAALVDAQPEQTQRQLWSSIESAASEYAAGGGTVELPNEVRYVVARVTG